jgi:hypothetical protein
MNNTRNFCTCIATGKSSAKSGGKKRSACFFENDGFPANKFQKVNSRSMINLITDDIMIHTVQFHNTPATIWALSLDVRLSRLYKDYLSHTSSQCEISTHTLTLKRGHL